jgi:hypothetical protein
MDGKRIITEKQAISRIKAWWPLKDIPNRLRSAAVCLAAVKQDGSALEDVPEELKTAKLCLEAVKQRGCALEFVPEELRTAELCLEAVKENGYALEYVPEELKTAELCLVAVKQNGHALRYVPKELKTAKLCLEAVKENGEVLEFVPEELKTAELCLMAVQQKGWALKNVPEELKTTELCIAAYKESKYAVGFMTDAGLDAIFKDNFRTISTADELAELAELVNNGENMEGKLFKLGCDIALNDTADWENWDGDSEGLREWIPVGNEENPFCGIFNGCGYVIKGVYINSEGGDQGLFGYIGGYFGMGHIRNLGVVDSYVKGNRYIGCLAGCSGDDGSICNCYATGKVFGGRDVGGLVGYSNGSISGSYAVVNVSATEDGDGENIGGFIGFLGMTCAIYDCYATGKVSGWNNVGGLVGFIEGDSDIVNCYATGRVEGSRYVGGLVGNLYGGSIKECLATGDVSGHKEIGGLVGEASCCEIINCYAIDDGDLGTEGHTGDDALGGLVGYSFNGCKIVNCYAFKFFNYSAFTSVGDLVGYTEAGCEFTNSYYQKMNVDDEIVDYAEVNAYNEGKGEDIELNDKNSYKGWDFENIWGIDPGINCGRPFLRKLATENGKIIIDEEALATEEQALALIKKHPYKFKKIPKKLKTASLCLTAVKQNGWMLEYVPEKLKTAKLCLAAVKQDGWALEYVPAKLEKLFRLTLDNDKDD